MAEQPDLPDTMVAAVYRGPGGVSLEEVPVPEVGPQDVLIEVSHCGICGSDIHFFNDGWGRPGSIEGHEYSGRVVAVGSEVGNWSVGDAVVGGPTTRCGVCEYCQAGRPSLCAARDTPGMGGPWQGAFARYKVQPASEVLALPPEVTLRQAALTEPLAVALHAITRAGVEPGHRVLVTGAGPIGTLVLSALRAQGIDDVVVSEPSEVRRGLAVRLGASEVVHPDELPAFVNPGEVRPDGFHVAFECSGHPTAMTQALGQLRRAGTLMLVGAGIKAPRFDNNRILLNELWISGSFVYDAHGFERALELMASGRLPLDTLIEPGDVPLDGLWDAIRSLAEGRVGGKVMVTP
jgi:2-desacetyl-2-hydroxyethyl bacteriochlorophyllide A dehydrogenase